MRRVGTKSWHRFMVPNCKRLWAVLFLLRVCGRVVYWILEDVYNGHVTPISAEDLGELRSKLPGEHHDRNAEEYIDKSYGFLSEREGGNTGWGFRLDTIVATDGRAAQARICCPCQCGFHDQVYGAWQDHTLGCGKRNLARHLGFEDMMEYKALELWP